MEEHKMQNTWALVTGAGGEIGRETAFRLTGAGANVVATDIAGTNAEQTAHLVEAAGEQSRAIHLDVSDPGRHQCNARVTGQQVSFCF